MITCLEFFAGIGGFHLALKGIPVNSKVLTAYDINTTTNSIYALNFPETTIRACNIQALSSDYLDEMKADLWTMSPPCQPFTKKGLKRDIDDNRCDALKGLLSALKNMKFPPRFVVLENVCGFEVSQAHYTLLQVLNDYHYLIEEFILSPLDIGMPNSRPRYYLLAKLSSDLNVYHESTIKTYLPIEIPHIVPSSVGDYLNVEEDNNSQLKICSFKSEKFISALDLVTADSTSSSCFTKSYASYFKGSGPIFISNRSKSMDDVKEIKEKLSNVGISDDECTSLISSLQLRYFSWREVANLLGVPSEFKKPIDISDKQMYRALGNSVNINLTRILLRYLLNV